MFQKNTILTTYLFLVFKLVLEAGEVTQWFRAPTILQEDPSSVPRPLLR